MAMVSEKQSLEELRLAVKDHFTENVHVSHGLFRSPYPVGAHLFCEVDSRTLPRLKCGDKNVEFVLRVVRLGDDDAACPRSIINMLNVLHNERTIHPASFEALVLSLENYICCAAGLEKLKAPTEVDRLCVGNSHPNIVPLIGAFLGRGTLFLVFPPAPYTLKSVLHFSPSALGDDWQLRLLIYQIITGVEHSHRLGVAHGNITPSNVLLTNSMWCWLTGFTSFPSLSVREPAVPDGELEWRGQFKKWWRGELSNFDYLLLLNRLAGRRWGDRCFHTVMPWVIDFTVKPDEGKDIGWRDLTKSKWRLAKGDEQLDFTFATADTPHHVSDECLSELAVCIYKARRLPLLVLRRVVRSVYEPNEYPANMQRLYHWTPDECIPEFYSDSQVFHSIHKGMEDLAVPCWAQDSDDFISLHRAALESDRVSKQLHHWIDLTFGYKLSGEAAVLAKNVTLSTTGPEVPRSLGRRQLFHQPHPARQVYTSAAFSLEQFEESELFAESARSLSPWYGASVFELEDKVLNEELQRPSSNAFQELQKFTESGGSDQVSLELDSDEEVLYEELAGWKVEASISQPVKESESADIFALGCLIAEIYLRRPLFDSTTAAAWLRGGLLPGLIDQLPPHVRVLVEETLLRDSKRRPSATELLASPFFSSTIRSAYQFLSSFHFLTSEQDRLHYAATLARQSAFVVMGPAVELCGPACLSILRSPFLRFNAKSVTILMKSLLQVLQYAALRRLLVPIVRSILQDDEAVQLKALLLGSTFMRNLRRLIGTSVYLRHLHGLVLLNVLRSGESSLGDAASLVLVDTCQDLGLPISLHQTVFPLLRSLGRDISTYGIRTIVALGERFGERDIKKHWLPPLRYILMLGAEQASEKSAPAQSWRLLAALDVLVVLERFIATLSPSTILQQLLQQPNHVFFKVLRQKSLPQTLLESAAKALLSACTHAGRDLTFSHLMGQFKQLFNDLAFWKDLSGSGSEVETGILVHILYPGLASMLGIEKLRQTLPAWILLEQGLAKKFNWKWTDTKPQPTFTSEPMSFQPHDTLSPASLLLDGVGWSVPQSQAQTWTGELSPYVHNKVESQEEPWFWIPPYNEAFSSTESVTRIGTAHAVTKEEQPWKLNVILEHSWKAHTGSMRTLALEDNESIVYTAGGVRGRSFVRKWELSTTKCVMEYRGHEEAVNSVCVLNGHDRTASCDGTIHIWNSETGKSLALLSELPSAGLTVPATDGGDITLSNGILSGGNVFTTMHFIDGGGKLVAGTASGYLRFVDIVQGRQLYHWRCESSDVSPSSFISSVTSTSPDTFERNSARPSWIAIGFSSGHCSLLDFRSGSVIGHWRAHGGHITHLAPLEETFLVSSSLDRTISIWDLRRSWPLEPQTFHGHSDGVTSFALWGTNILSAAGSKIGVSSFSKPMYQTESKQTIMPRKIYTADRSSRNLSTICMISVLPFSRHFLLGTEDGHLKICC